MKKSMRHIIVTILLLACSGCFPIFVPEGGGERGGHERHDEGDRRGHDHHDEGDR